MNAYSYFASIGNSHKNPFLVPKILYVSLSKDFSNFCILAPPREAITPGLLIFPKPK